MSQKRKIVCLMPTYNRPSTERTWLLEESVMSFLLQDYENKVLYICNDTPYQQLKCNYPGVVIENLNERFDNLCDKIIYMLEQYKDEDVVFTRWDDDDISLPWRLSLSMEKMGSNTNWHPRNHWYCHGEETKIQGMTEDPGNVHNMQLFTHETLKAMGGYPRFTSCGEDQEFIRFLENSGKVYKDVLPESECFYLYRFGVSDIHLSNYPANKSWDVLARQPVHAGTYHIKPAWKRDYCHLIEEYLSAKEQITY